MEWVGVGNGEMGEGMEKGRGREWGKEGGDGEGKGEMGEGMGGGGKGETGRGGEGGDGEGEGCEGKDTSSSRLEFITIILSLIESLRLLPIAHACSPPLICIGRRFAMGAEFPTTWSQRTS